MEAGGLLEVPDIRADAQVAELRAPFQSLTDHLEQARGFPRDRLAEAQLREASLTAEGLGLDRGQTVSTVVAAEALETERFLDAEFVAIYW